jgi:hypothetical protein
VARTGSRNEGCRGAEHGQTSTKDRNDAVAVREVLESAVQLGRGDEVNRQAEMEIRKSALSTVRRAEHRSVSRGRKLDTQAASNILSAHIDRLPLNYCW